MDKRIKISIIAVNYNGKGFLKDCIESIQGQKYIGEFEIIVVDNNSNDYSIEYIKHSYPDVICIENSINLGHAEASNQGAEIAKGEYLFFIDNDTYFDENCLMELMKVIHRENNVGAVGGMIIDYGNSNIIQDFGMSCDIFGYPYSLEGSINKNYNKNIGQYRNIKEAFYISSCALLIRKDLFMSIRGFDSAYFIYKDDLDLCWRVKLAGYRVLVTPYAKIYHKMGVTLGGTTVAEKEKYSTSAKKRYYGEKNTIRTLLKNYSLIALLVIAPIYLLISFFEVVFFLLMLKFSVVKAYISSYIWNIKNFKTIMIERKEIKKYRRKSDIRIMQGMHFVSYKIRVLFKIGMPKFK